MKLFFFITKSEAGGAQTHVAQLARCLVASGDTVAIMSTPGDWLEVETRNMGARFFPNLFLGNTARPWQLFKAAHTLTRAIRDFQPDIVACHSTMAGLLGRVTIRNRIPTIFTAHGWGFTQGAPLVRRILLPILERVAARFCSKIICVSQNDLALARAHHIAPEKKLVQIYNGIEIPTEIASSRTPPADATALAGRRNDKTINLFFVGRLAPPKDPDLLVQAIGQLPPDLQQRLRVTIIGSGPDRHRLQAAMNDAGLEHLFQLVGALPREEVLKRLQEEADLFVFPTHWEGFPYAVLEAMSCGLPVIASNVGGIAEAVDETCGLLVLDNDVSALTQALVILIQDESRREAMGKAGRARALEHFSAQSMCDRTLSVYREVL